MKQFVTGNVANPRVYDEVIEKHYISLQSSERLDHEPSAGDDLFVFSRRARVEDNRPLVQTGRVVRLFLQRDVHLVLVFLNQQLELASLRVRKSRVPKFVVYMGKQRVFQVIETYLLVFELRDVAVVQQRVLDDSLYDR